jgi:hypothetical protein
LGAQDGPERAGRATREAEMAVEITRRHHDLKELGEHLDAGAAGRAEG